MSNVRPKRHGDVQRFVSARLRLAFVIMLAVLAGACNRDSGAPKSAPAAEISHPESAPVFRNLGKRGENGA